MKQEDPPIDAHRNGDRAGKFDAIREGLVAAPGVWFNITEDLAGSENKKPPYFRELARSITAGNRAGFKPRGAFEGSHRGTEVWARCLNADLANQPRPREE